MWSNLTKVSFRASPIPHPFWVYLTNVREIGSQVMGKRNGYWQTHKEPELQQLLMEFHQADWRIVDPGKYYKLFCPCKEHKTTMHISPSGANYALDKRKWLHRQPCYKGEK